MCHPAPQSTFKKEFPRHALPEKEARKQAARPKSLPFTGSTTCVPVADTLSSLAHVSHALRPAHHRYGDMPAPEFPIDEGGDMAAYRPPPEKSAPFVGDTENRSAFTGAPVDRGAKIRPPREHGIGVGEGKFNPETENAMQFPWQQPVRRSARP